ncbi:MAG: cation transporter [Clostridiales bacterium]|nr:cation transporter [Clostridiales bacterium]MBQ2769321.1 cation transporter [Clostridia bacterium]
MEQNKSRNNQGKKAGLIGIIANLLLASGKLVAGILAGATSIIADALNNFSDGLSAVVTTVGFKLAQKPADSDHPYGHARFEYVASLIVAIMVLFVGFELIKSSIEKIIAPQAIEFSYLAVAILGASIIAKFLLFLYNGRAAKKINSETLKATSIDCRNDVIVTTSVLIAVLIERFTGWKIDGFMGLAVALFIIFSGIKLTLETVSPILGKKNNESLKAEILEKIKEYPIVIGYHDLMIHDYGPGISFCSIHFEIDKNHDPLYVHELIDKFEREFLAKGTNLTVHYDPVVTDSPKLNRLKELVLSVLTSNDPRLSLHDFRSIPCDGFTKVFFDVPLPEDMAGRESGIKEAIDSALNALGEEKYSAEITFDSVAFN